VSRSRNRASTARSLRSCRMRSASPTIDPGRRPHGDRRLSGMEQASTYSSLIGCDSPSRGQRLQQRIGRPETGRHLRREAEGHGRVAVGGKIGVVSPLAGWPRISGWSRNFLCGPPLRGSYGLRRNILIQRNIDALKDPSSGTASLLFHRHYGFQCRSFALAFVSIVLPIFHSKFAADVLI
jgi:hypothetical protein